MPPLTPYPTISIHQASTHLLRFAHQNALQKSPTASRPRIRTTPPRPARRSPASPVLRTKPTLRHQHSFRTPAWPPRRQPQTPIHPAPLRPFSTSHTPQARPPIAPRPTAPTPLSLSDYHKLSDTYIDALVSQLEELQEEREDVDVEYSAGVLTLTFPPHGTYVLNKQPPNKQIWLSSPVSGPKRYDWVASERQGGKGEGEGEWVYLRDGSTLSGLLEGEVGVVAGKGVVGEED
ncbi:hypothetical protein N7G274_000900 [Stereocaulon virgatum]|uniref:ferroxidase n=1 Tax=Stereocaulon virgatum TaxID=373712 RepID=A0ABR4AMB2_9LECA